MDLPITRGHQSEIAVKRVELSKVNVLFNHFRRLSDVVQRKQL